MKSIFIKNQNTNKVYSINFNTYNVWHCDNCSGNHYKAGTFVSFQVSTSSEDIGNGIEKITKIFHRVKLSNKDIEWECPQCRKGKIRYYGYKVWVEDITEQSKSSVGGITLVFGSKVIDKQYCPTLQSRDAKVKELIHFYESKSEE